MIDAHQHFWRYDPVEYGWIDASMAVLRRDFLPPDAWCEMTRAAATWSSAAASQSNGAANQSSAVASQSSTTASQSNRAASQSSTTASQSNRAASQSSGVVIAVQARQTLDETRWLLSLADAYPFIAGVVGWVDLRADDVRAQLEEVAAHPKLVGVRHIVQSEPDDQFLLRPDFCRGMALLEEFGLAYDILIYRRHLGVAAELADRFPSQRFVLDHLAKPDIRGGEIRGWERDLRTLAACPNVWGKLSGLVTEADWRAWMPRDIRPYLDVAFDCFGADRLMIGSDWPVCTVAADYTRTMGVVIDYLADRPAHERDAVLGANARRFWNLM